MLVLPAQLTHAQAGASLHMLRLAVPGESDSEILADASALTHFDSSALAVLLDMRREGLRQGRSLRVLGMPERLRNLADLYGVLGLLEPAPASEQADSAESAGENLATAA